MQGFQKINLLDVLKYTDEISVKEALANFSCPNNADVEDFIRNKAIEFSRQRLASVWLVLVSHKDEWVTVGYFAIAQKYTHVKLKGLSSNLKRRLKKFVTFDEELNKYLLAAPLIGQLGKNFTNSYDKLITGAELLKIACDTVAEGQRIFGGRVVYLECEDVPALINFYERNGFVQFGQRVPAGDERDKLKNHSLVQLLKYLSD
ncbi:MAG: N-acetyltransferase [Selenomonadaceae bacterium]|nr:N-acetyltransferase [Selenomonadaceae bacterium]